MGTNDRADAAVRAMLGQILDRRRNETAAMDARDRDQSDRRPVILVVDDDPAVRLALRRLLSKLGEVVDLPDAVRATRWIHAGGRPDVVVTDVTMPVLSGFDLARSLKADSRTAAVPVVILSALCGTADKVAGLQAGIRHYVTKPFRSADLLARVGECVSMSLARRSVARTAV
jgi:DNA-binding response OmpR family regulator